MIAILYSILIAAALVSLVVWFANAMYKFGYRRGWREREMAREQEQQHARED